MTRPIVREQDVQQPVGSPPEPAEILLVDDRGSNLLAAEATLATVARVVRAASGAEALRLLLTRDVALILLDVQMPGMDGFQTAEIIRSREHNASTPLIFLTAHVPTEAELLRGYALGAADYLIKPYLPEVLRAKAALFVELHERRRREAGLRAELARSSVDLNRFAQAAAHALRAPLRGLAEHLSRISEATLAPGPDAAQGLEGARDDVERMRQMIDGLLAYAQARTRAANPQPVDAGEVLADALLGLRSSIQGSGAEITHGTLPVIETDPFLLRQLFQQLLENALTFRGPEAPRIHVDCRRAETGWEFAVRDNGLGIDPKDHEAIFEPFRRLLPRASHGGTGLGLAICKEVVSRQGGRIWVESELGRGADFRFTLPAA